MADTHPSPDRAAATDPRTVAANRPAADRGRLVIADRVVERIAAKAAVDVPGVVPVGSGLAGLVGARLPKADARIGGQRVRVKVQIAAQWPTPLPTLTRQVRDAVTGQITRLVGYTVDSVDVEAADVVTPRPQTRTVQ